MIWVLVHILHVCLYNYVHLLYKYSMESGRCYKGEIFFLLSFLFFSPFVLLLENQCLNIYQSTSVLM